MKHPILSFFGRLFEFKFEFSNIFRLEFFGSEIQVQFSRGFLPIRISLEITDYIFFIDIHRIYGNQSIVISIINKKFRWIFDQFWECNLQQCSQTVLSKTLIYRRRS